MSQLSKETLLGGLHSECPPLASSGAERPPAPPPPTCGESPKNLEAEAPAASSACLAPGAEDAALRDTRSWEKSRASSESLVGITVGSYKVTRLLGEGSVGAVYLGEHPLVGARVAIKVLHDDIAQSKGVVSRFLTEARAANQIPSRHIVPVTDFGKLPDGRDYAVMEYLDGQSLEAVLASEGRIAWHRVTAILCQVAEAMAEAHARGIVHRDLKPENLFLQRESSGQEFVRILDFGIAKLVHEPPSNARGTAVGAFLGTPLYCSPEQAVGHAVGPATDIYALGAIAYELLTGQPLFEANNVVEMLLLKASRTITSLDKLPAGVPQELVALIVQCLARSPEERPESMAIVANRLRRILGQMVADRSVSMPSEAAQVAQRARDEQSCASSDEAPNPTRCSEAGHTMLPVTRSDATGLQVVGERRRRAPVLLAVGAAAIAVMAIVGWSSLRPSASQAAGSLQEPVGSAPTSAQASAGEMLPPAVVPVAASSEPPISPSAQVASADSASAAPPKKSVSSSGSRHAPTGSTALSPVNATAKEKRPPAKKPPNLVDPFN